MLLISPIKFSNPFKIQKNNYNKVGFQGSNLKPLAHDTISFSGARSLNENLLGAFKNEEQCKEVEINASSARDTLEQNLNEVFSDIQSNEANKGVIFPIQTRIKGWDSIREKTASKLEEAIINHDIDNFINPNKPADIKKIINDIIGARFIVKKADEDANRVIIDRLIELVEANKLKITSIDVILPENSDDFKPYIKNDDLEELAAVANIKNKENHLDIPEVKVNPIKSMSGYSAIHIDVDLSDDEMPVKFSDYKGELQIIGGDVAYFKDLEDLCYKLLQNKNIKSGHGAYQYFVNYFENNLYNRANVENIQNLSDKEFKIQRQQDFQEYTRLAYIIQRKKNPQASNYDKGHFPTLEECGMQDILPPQLDFNKLMKLKESCDKIYKTTIENSFNNIESFGDSCLDLWFYYYNGQFSEALSEIQNEYNNMFSLMYTDLT